MIIFNFLLYYLFIIPVSLLPFRALYLVSDLLFVVLYRVIKYRTKVVRTNLKHSFPEKSEADLKKIELAFYRHLGDVIVETFKSFTITKEEVLKRMVLQNPEVINHYYDHGRSVLIAGGHYNNWEWIATSLEQQIKHQAIAIYTPLSNKFFEQKMKSTRSRFGLTMIGVKLVDTFFEENINRLTATVFAIDQSPRNPARCHWTTFLHQPTPVMYGLEKYAKNYDYPVLFGYIEKVKRGFYTLRFEVAVDQPPATDKGEILNITTKLLEDQIIEKPAYWLWTHKRWKHSNKYPGEHKTIDTKGIRGS